MYTIVFFRATEDLTEDGHERYCDALYSMECDYRPMVGDVFYLGESSIFGTAAYEVEVVVCVGGHAFHAYCTGVEPDESYPPYYGARGVKGSLIAHTQDQMKDFPERYRAQ